MLRRPPTTLTITAEDVAAYEDRRASEALQARQQQQQAQQQQQQQQAQAQRQQEDLTPGQAARRAREERLGVTRRPGAGGGGR
ncbi:hypothetical protein ACCO45_006626 [Purpureocillium lilacinum]|uniref:Uncharacterized protein n=1 Tax=Purpureocillium lilacinum TaxID=33203 RepID=A0ACC4DRF5_PURLI